MPLTTHVRLLNVTSEYELVDFPVNNNNMQLDTADFISGAATWRNGRNIRVVFDSGLLSPLYGKMTSIAKPEVRSISHCSQIRNEPRLYDHR